MIELNTKEFKLTTAALAVGSFLVFSNLYITQPLLPLFRDEFGISINMANWSLAISTLMLGISLLIFAPLSDIFGRRTLMRISLIGVSVFALLLVFVDDFKYLVVMRGIQGFFLAGLPAIAVAYIADEYSKSALGVAVGIYIAANSLGGISGRLLSGFMATHFNWHYSFITMAVLDILCLAFFWWALPKSKNFVAGSANFHLKLMLGNIAKHIKNPALFLVYLMGGLNFFIFVNQYTFIAYRFIQSPFNLSLAFTSLLFITYLTGTYASFISGKLALKHNLSNIMLIGIVVLFLGSSITLLNNIYIIIGGLFINAFGFFLAHSTATAWVSRHAKYAKASASAIYLVFYYLGASTGGFYLNIFWQSHAWQGVVFASYAILTLSLLAIFLAKKYE